MCSLLASLLASLCAQSPQPARFPHSGRVIDAHGTSVANAHVTVVSTSPLSMHQEASVVSATTDAEGRFRAALDAARGYVAWAAVERPQGTLVTPPVEVSVAPIDIRLSAQDVVAPRHFAVGNAALWQEHGPLRVEIVPRGCRALDLRGRLDADGKLPLPPLPDLLCEVRVFARDRLVHHAVCLLHHGLQLPVPRRIAVRVQDDKGQPRAGVVVHRLTHAGVSDGGPFAQAHDAERHPLATTAEDGTAEILVACATDPLHGAGDNEIVFAASLPAHAESMSGFSTRPFVDGVAVKEPSALHEVLQFTLRAQAERRLAVKTAAGAEPPSIRLLGLNDVPLDLDKSTTMPVAHTLPVASGEVRLPAFGGWHHAKAIEVAGQMAPLAADDPYRRIARPTTLTLPASRLVAVESIDLSALVALRLQLLDGSSGPAIGAHVLCTPEDGNAFLDPAYGMRAQTDRSGRLVLPLTAGRWCVLAVLDDAWGHLVVDVVHGLAPQSLQLQPLDRMPVRVVDGQGAPLANVRFTSDGASWRGGGSPQEELLRNVAWGITRWSLQRKASDANGHADLFFLAARNMQTNLTTVHRDKTEKQGYLRVDEDRLDLVLR